MAKVTIDGKEYESDGLSEDVRNNLLNIKYCDKKLDELKCEQAIVQTARNAYANSLKAGLGQDLSELP